MTNCTNCWTGGFDTGLTECPECGYNPSQELQRLATRRLLIGMLISACGLVTIAAGLSAHVKADDATATLDH